MSAQFLQSSPSEWNSLQGKGSQGGPSVVARVLCQLSQQWLQAPPWPQATALPYSTEMFSALKKSLFPWWLPFPSTYPPSCWYQSPSFFSSKDQTEAKDGSDGDWDDPKYSHRQKQREGAIHTPCLDYKQGDTKWHRFLGCHYFSYRPRLSGLLICLCFLSVVFSISGCCSRDLPCLPGWYALYPEQQRAEVCSKTLMWLFQFKTL